MKQILIVEDDWTSRELLTCFLSSFDDYRLTSASDLNQAREILQTRGFDLVVLDVNLPDGNGLDLLYELRHHRSYTNPVLILSGLHQEVNVYRGLETGAEDYMTKPFNIDEFLLHLKRLLQTEYVPVY